ncbi:MAG: penicillin-binding protein 2 [Alphaproteobacteria bacterium]|nr:penicillin-binding protein 2 [Alphaproteobacteria bacterium]
MLQNEKFQKELIFRQNIMKTVVIILSLILVGNLYFLQVKHSKKYQLLSDKNRIRLMPLLPKRGNIFSSDGTLLAYSECNHKVVMDYCSLQVFKSNIKILQTCLNLTKNDILKLESRRKSRVSEIVVKESISREEYVKVMMNLFKCNGVYITNSYLRRYNMPEELSHIIGYTSKLSDEIQILEGKTGLELFFNEQLSGMPGNIQKEINSVGKKIRTIDQEAPVDGQDIILSINAKLQKYVYNLLKPYHVGACCVLDMEGKVLALVSYPGYNINSMSMGPSVSEWKNWNSSQYKPLLDRAVYSSYPPGSVFKIIVAYAALKEGIIKANHKFLCTGGIKQDNHVFHCWNRAGHGWIDMVEALSKSCDCYFFEIAKKLGIEKIQKYAKEFGLGNKTGIELPNEKRGLIPSKEWKFLKHKSHWKTYETMLAGIGQGSVLTTLIQVATMMGKLYSNNLNYSVSLLNDHSNSNRVLPIDKKSADTVKEGLRQVCYLGTASGSCRTLYGISGKTGSSQVRKLRSDEVGINQNLIKWKYRDHAFFVGVAPTNKPKYIVTVFIEHGGGGAKVAAPVARKIFDKLIMEKHEN